MAAFGSFAEAIKARADSAALAHYVVDTVSAFTDGKDVAFDFLAKDAVGRFCRSLGVRRNWATLTLEQIAPEDKLGCNVVPIGEADKILGLLAALIRDGYLTPEDEDGEPAPTILNDFLQRPKSFQGERTLGHLDEFAYALAVELEHGRARGQNVTMNHPLLTGMVVMAHLAEDTLYYARLRVMEAEGELFNQQLDKASHETMLETATRLADARTRLAARMSEKLAHA